MLLAMPQNARDAFQTQHLHLFQSEFARKLQPLAGVGHCRVVFFQPDVDGAQGKARQYSVDGRVGTGRNRGGLHGVVHGIGGLVQPDITMDQMVVGGNEPVVYFLALQQFKRPQPVGKSLPLFVAAFVNILANAQKEGLSVCRECGMVFVQAQALLHRIQRFIEQAQGQLCAGKVVQGTGQSLRVSRPAIQPGACQE